MAKKSAFKERRAKPRAPLQVEATVIVGGESHGTTTSEISVGGLSVISSVSCQKGSQVAVKFFLPESEEPLKVAAVIEGVQFTQSRYVWRMKFINPNYRTVGEIERYVRQHLVSKAREKYQSKPRGRPPVGRRRKSKSTGGGLSGFIKKVFKKG